MATRRIADDEGMASVRAAAGGQTDRATTATAVRYLLQALADRAPGKTVEVRVPPFGAVQCVEGLRHTRGTPPNVIETDPETWIALATGAEGWSEAVAGGRISASGSRADLADWLPLVRVEQAGCFAKPRAREWDNDHS